ncbi:hypothetical protein ACN9M1_26480 (plasmid) [Ralstonia sp. R-29]|uniref:hypothetical protein n=1 Tax=Ralstonia sp. R-29 TaxID=3404059 RepID=UPI003CF02244
MPHTLIEFTGIDRREIRVTPTEFLEGIKPAARRSKLLPWLADIRTLRTAGCSIAQIREYLATNGLTVGLSTLAAFVVKHADGTASKDTGRPVATAVAPRSTGTQASIEPERPATEGIEAYKTTEQLAKENPKLNKRAILDLYARQFQVDPPNPLAELLRKQEERKRLAREQAAAGGAGPTAASG